MSDTPEFKLYYWPHIQGRGEFVRLALEDAGASYVDVARRPEGEGGGIPAIIGKMKNPGEALEPFAPPFLEHGGVIVGHTALVLAYLGPKLGLVPADETLRLRAQQMQLQITDFVAEVHETHHPIASSMYYEEQKSEASRRTFSFLKDRVPKFLGYFERVLEKNGGAHFVGDAVSYVDLSMFQVIEGMRYAFPNAMRKAESKAARVIALHDAVAKRPRIASYLASSRRIAFNEQGIFRRYPELDSPE